jgi:hypothetical protein
MRHRTAPSDTNPLGDWTYSETIDEESSVIRVHGRVDRLGVDLLRGTIEDLQRRGHRDITVTLDDQAAVDPGSQEVLTQIAGHLADCQGRLRVRWAEGNRQGHAEPAGTPGNHRTGAISGAT